MSGHRLASEWLARVLHIVAIALLSITSVLAVQQTAFTDESATRYGYDEGTAPSTSDDHQVRIHHADQRILGGGATSSASAHGYDDLSDRARAYSRPSGYRLAPQTTLYRAVSKAELDDVAANGFRASERSMSGKFFAETPEHAAEWGRRLIYGKEGIPFHVVETRVPTSFADRLMRWDKLDGIGPARYVDDFLLDELNRLRSPIVDLPAIPRG